MAIVNPTDADFKNNQERALDYQQYRSTSDVLKTVAEFYKVAVLKEGTLGSVNHVFNGLTTDAEVTSDKIRITFNRGSCVFDNQPIIFTNDFIFEYDKPSADRTYYVYLYYKYVEEYPPNFAFVRVFLNEIDEPHYYLFARVTYNSSDDSITVDNSPRDSWVADASWDNFHNYQVKEFWKKWDFDTNNDGYLNANELIEIIEIKPSGNDREYLVAGDLVIQNGVVKTYKIGFELWVKSYDIPNIEAYLLQEYSDNLDFNIFAKVDTDNGRVRLYLECEEDKIDYITAHMYLFCKEKYNDEHLLSNIIIQQSDVIDGDTLYPEIKFPTYEEYEMLADDVSYIEDRIDELDYYKADKKGSDDIIITDENRGLILKDRATGTCYRLYIENGSLGIEDVDSNICESNDDDGGAQIQ